jgi:hypothetical protein
MSEPEVPAETDADADAGVGADDGTGADADDADADADRAVDLDRPAAELTVGGALRCHLDQLPPDRCVLCATTGVHDDALGLTLCQHHRQRPRVPLLLGGVLTVSTTIFTVLHGADNLMQTVCGFLLALACFGIARQRYRLRAKFPALAPGSTFIELPDVAPDVARTVVALGSRPYRRALPAARTVDP